KPQIGYSSAGGDVTWMVGLVEDNLLGTATSLTAVYNKTPDRRIFDLGYVNPHFFSRRGWLQAKYSNKSDGKRGTWLVGVPFYETAARHALITDGEAASERVLVFRRDPLGRREDVDMSQALHVGVWAAPRAWGYPSGQAGVGPEVSVQLAAPWRRGFAVLRAGANGVLTAGAPDSARAAGALTVASQNLRDQT